MTPQFKWLLYSIILTILLNVALDAFAEEPITCEQIVESVTMDHKKQTSDLLSEIVTRCDKTQCEILEFEQDGEVIKIMCWKVQVI